MNLADYLSELLGQHDEVSVPGLGCFLRERIKGYYNDKEAKFYPPQHRVKFIPKPKDDDDLFTQYVADKKNISLASSKYFAEKFIAKVWDDAGRGKFVFSDLGFFTQEQGQLVFRPYDKIAEDPAFYGYAPVNIYKASEAALGTHPAPVFSQPLKTVTSPALATTSAPLLTHKPIQGSEVVSHPEYFDEEPESRHKLSLWAIILIALVVIGLALFGIYRFLPATFQKISTAYHNVINRKDSTISVMRHQVTGDTTKKVASVKDSAKLKAVADDGIADTVRHSRFELVENSYSSIAKAKAAVNYFKAHGLDSAKILVDAPGPLLKVSVGTFKTYEEAVTARGTLIGAGKIKDSSKILGIQ